MHKLALLVCLNLGAISVAVADNASSKSAAADPQNPQWVQSPVFPPAPGGFSGTNYNTNNYQNPGSNGNGQPYNPNQNRTGQAQNGVAPLPPLVPPGGFDRAKSMISPFTPEQIKELRLLMEGARRAKSFKPVRTVPRISGESVDLSPGAAIPILRTLPGEMSTLVFIDSTGEPWPLATVPRVSGGNNNLFSVEWLDESPTVIVSALTAYGEGNLTVLLKGLATPVVVKLVTGEADSKKKLRVVDFRKDLRIPGRGPYAKAPVQGPDKIGLYDDTLQSFLDGVKPAGAKAVKWVAKKGSPSDKVQIWQYNRNLYLRTRLDIQSAFDKSLSSSDGTKIYSLPLTPYINLSDMSRSVVLLLNIDQ